MRPILSAFMKMRRLNVNFLLLLLIFAGNTVIAQNANQRLQIQSQGSKKSLDSLVDVFSRKNKNEETQIIAYLQRHPEAKRMFEKNSSVYFLQKIGEDGQPIYINTKNKASGEMIGANQLYAGGTVGSNINGTGMIAGIWDGGQVRATHELLVGKVAMQTGQTLTSVKGDNHMTHVSGTIVGKDIANQPSARGIAFGATAMNYDFDNDKAEMTTFAANGFILSNHSYGYTNDNTIPAWQFGAYDDEAKAWDVITKNAPFYLPFVAAGNEQQSNGNTSKAGFDLITGSTAAKNVMTVGALNGDSTMSDYSNWGPTDDGRFKPEIVAKGTGINSSLATSDQAYSGNGPESSGTSYATPAVTAVAVLLQQYYHNLTSVYMRSATLKALMLHTAFDLGNPGPDYKFGWGLTSADKAGLLIKKAKTTNTPQGSSITEINTNPINNGTDEMVINVFANGTEPLKVSIAWTDDDGTQQTSADGVDPTTGRLVYNFDVLVRNASNSTETRPWRPMGMANRTANATKGTAWFENDNNNYRQVLIDNPVANGSYVIVIRKSASSPATVRPFSLIISGLKVSLISDQFRTKQAGNWNDINTWESSSDGTTWSAATITPDFNSGAITILNGHTVTVTSNITTDQTTINSGGSLVVNPGIILTVNDGTGTDLTVSSGGSMTIKSTLAGTGSIGNSTTATITGDVTVERYISDKRAWRLLGVPFSASNQTIKTSWMEGAANSTSNPVPGYGTHITTFTGDGNSAGFDAVKPASSIRTYLTNTFTSDGTHTPPTTTNIAANQAYFLFVRGNRSINLTTSTDHSATTLRITGTITTGAVTKGVTGTNSLIPNPYPSAIDFDVVKASNSSIGIFYVWDATLAGPSGVGQYRTVQISGSGPNYTYTATPGSADNKWRYIESGTAFFIQGSGTVNFTEAMKTAGIPPSSMLRVTSPNQAELAVNLNIVNADNTTSLADGVREVFDNSYSTAIDNNDAKKIAGFNLNLGISSNSEILAIEKRPLPNANDVITLSLSNMAQGNYQFELQPANLPGNLTAYLKDNYLGTYTAIDVTSDTKINFTINADAASSSENRFSIVFGKPQLVNPNSLITVYPNPVSNGVVTLQMNNMPKGVYQVRLLNAVGQTMMSKQINHAGGSSTETFNVNKVKGAYTIEVTKPDNSKINSKIIIN